MSTQPELPKMHRTREQWAKTNPYSGGGIRDHAAPTIDDALEDIAVLYAHIDQLKIATAYP